MPALTHPFLRATLLVLLASSGATDLAAQADLDLPGLARWFESEAPLLAQSSDESTATGNLRMADLRTRATFELNECTLRVTLTDNSGVNGSTVTTEVPLTAVDSAKVRLVTRANGWRDFLYIPGRYFVVVPAREGGDWPFRTTTSRGTLKANSTTVPARNPDAGAQLMTAVHRAGVLCGALANRPS